MSRGNKPVNTPARVQWLYGDKPSGVIEKIALASDNTWKALLCCDDGTYLSVNACELVDEDQAPVLDDDATRGELAREDLDTLAEYLREHHGIDDAEPDEVDSAIAVMESLRTRADAADGAAVLDQVLITELRTKVAELEAALAEAKKAGRKGSLLEKK